MKKIALYFLITFIASVVLSFIIFFMTSVAYGQDMPKDVIFDPVDMHWPDMRLNMPIPEPIPEGDFVQVKDGEKIVCALCGKTLKNVEVKYLPVEEVGQGIYFDDGTHGDEKANDGIFSQINVIRNVICEDDNTLKERFEWLCEKSLDTDVLDFYGIPYATDRSSDSVTARFLIDSRNNFVIDFRKKHLEKFIDDETGQYYLVYKNDNR